MANLREFTYPSSDGIHQVHAAEWTPENGGPRAVLQLVHGISEYILRYDGFARFMADHGFVVVGNDHLGHGGTAVGPEEYGFLAEKDGWTHITDDVRLLRVLTGERYGGLPYFLLGHSMGSFVARTYLIRWPGTVDGAILSGTGQEPAPLVAFGRAASGALCALRGPSYVSALIYQLSLGAYNRRFRPNRTTGDWLSRDPVMVDEGLRDPLCSFRPTVSMFRDMMTGLQFIGQERNVKKMDPSTPVYFFSGEQDPVGSMGKGVKKVAGLFRRAGCRDVTVKLYSGGRHEMLHETNRQEVLADLLSWLEGHMPH